MLVSLPATVFTEMHIPAKRQYIYSIRQATIQEVESMEKVRVENHEKPIVVNFTSTNEINMKQAVRMIIESHDVEEKSIEYEDYREAL